VLKALEEARDSQRQEIDKLRVKIDDLVKIKEELRKALQKIEKEKEDMLAKIAEYERGTLSLTEELSGKSEHCDKLEEALARLKTELTESENKICQLDRHLDFVKEQQCKESGKFIAENRELRTNLESARSRSDELAVCLEEMRISREEQSKKCEEANQEIAKLGQKCVGLEDRNEQLISDKKDMHISFKEKEESVERAQKQIDCLKKDHEAKVNEMRSCLEEKEAKIGEKDEKIDRLKELILRKEEELANEKAEMAELAREEEAKKEEVAANHAKSVKELEGKLKSAHEELGESREESKKANEDLMKTREALQETREELCHLRQVRSTKLITVPLVKETSKKNDAKEKEIESSKQKSKAPAEDIMSSSPKTVTKAAKQVTTSVKTTTKAAKARASKEPASRRLSNSSPSPKEPEKAPPKTSASTIFDIPVSSDEDDRFYQSNTAKTVERSAPGASAKENMTKKSKMGLFDSSEDESDQGDKGKGEMTSPVDAFKVKPRSYLKTYPRKKRSLEPEEPLDFDTVMAKAAEAKKNYVPSKKPRKLFVRRPIY